MLRGFSCVMIFGALIHMKAKDYCAPDADYIYTNVITTLHVFPQTVKKIFFNKIVKFCVKFLVVSNVV